MQSGYDQFFKQAKKNADPATSGSYEAKVSDRKNQISDLVKKKRIENRKNKKKFPILSFISFGFCAVAMFFLIEKFDSIETFISKIEIGLGSEMAIAATDTKNEKSPDLQKKDDSLKVEVKTEDEADYLFKLAERKKQLDSREEDLNKQAAEIQKQKHEIEEKLKSIEASREKISGLLKDRISADSQKVDTLVQVYSNMKPNQAAKIFETMDEDLVIDILTKMKKKNAADILNLVKSDKAKILSEKFAGYRSIASTPEKTELNEAKDNTNNLENEDNPKP